jgi:hypothetical protein
MDKTVYVVHCVDAEGPLYEGLDAKFDRIQAVLGVSGLEQSWENFNRIMAGEVDLRGRQAQLRELFSAHRTNYMDSWTKVEDMVARATAPEFRARTPDSFGRSYVYSWFMLDLVGFDVNPRRRALGYHVVHDFYTDLLTRDGPTEDGIYWHFHCMSTYREAHRNATSLLNSAHVWETLARRIIERRYFPSCVRCGFQTERPDIHWFLEQYIPFDFTNTAVESAENVESQADLAHGRFCDWRLAPRDWSVYRPSHDNYQVPGGCRRWIARALNVLNRFANLEPFEVKKAFARAQRGLPTLLAVASHDFRDLMPEVDYLGAELAKAQAEFPDVRYRYCDAREAMRAVVYGGEASEPLRIALRLERDSRGLPAVLQVDTRAGTVFGPQPFLAIQTRSQRFIHDNLDFSTDLRSWRYVFDADSILPEDVVAIGVGANDKFGNSVVEVIRVDG